MKLPIYMDHHATTPVDPRVFEAMTPYFTRVFGNAASRSHVFGWEAEAAVDEARRQVAQGMNASPKEIVFTSGATEGDNLAILGAARAYRTKGNHIVTGATEHHAVLDSCHELEREGFEVTYLVPDRTGRIDPVQVREAIGDRTILVTLMLANNEIGTIHPLAPIGAVCREKEVLFHTDAVQGFGKIPFDVEAMSVDLASVTAHKLYGPKGVGAVYVRARKPRVRVDPILYGGGHERGLRSGTLNVPGIVGFGKAVEISMAEREAEARRLRLLRRRLFDGILAEVSDVAVSSGSACTSASLQPSHVLKAIGVPDELAHASIRFGLGRPNTAEEVDFTIGAVAATVKRLRELMPGMRDRKVDELRAGLGRS